MLDFPASWIPLSPEKAAPLDAELAREVGPRHALYRRPATAAARRLDCDDVLYALRDPGGFALVHLTYAGRRETSPDWPATQIFTSMDQGRQAIAEEDG